MDWETARRWLEIMAKNVFDPNQPAYIVVLQRVEELEAALKLGAEAYVAALPDASTDAMTDLTIERNALRHENERLRGAMAADDKRLADAAVRVWGEHRWGCDTPDQMADTIIDLRAEVERLRADVLYEQDRNRNNVTAHTARVRTLEDLVSQALELGARGFLLNPECDWAIKARAALRKEGK